MTKKKDLNPSTAQVNANDARIDRLKEQLELGVCGQPLSDRMGFMNDVVVENQHDPLGAPVGSA